MERVFSKWVCVLECIISAGFQVGAHRLGPLFVVQYE